MASVLRLSMLCLVLGIYATTGNAWQGDRDSRQAEQVAHSGAKPTATLAYSDSDGGPERKLLEGTVAPPVVPAVTPAPRVAESAARPAPVAQAARQASPIPGVSPTTATNNRNSAPVPPARSPPPQPRARPPSPPAPKAPSARPPAGPTPGSPSPPPPAKAPVASTPGASPRPPAPPSPSQPSASGTKSRPPPPPSPSQPSGSGANARPPAPPPPPAGGGAANAYPPPAPLQPPAATTGKTNAPTAPLAPKAPGISTGATPSPPAPAPPGSVTGAKAQSPPPPMPPGPGSGARAAAPSVAMPNIPIPGATVTTSTVTGGQGTAAVAGRPGSASAPVGSTQLERTRSIGSSGPAGQTLTSATNNPFQGITRGAQPPGTLLNNPPGNLGVGKAGAGPTGAPQTPGSDIKRPIGATGTGNPALGGSASATPPAAGANPNTVLGRSATGPPPGSTSGGGAATPTGAPSSISRGGGSSTDSATQKTGGTPSVSALAAPRQPGFFNFSPIVTSSRDIQDSGRTQGSQTTVLPAGYVAMPSNSDISRDTRGNAAAGNPAAVGILPTRALTAAAAGGVLGAAAVPGMSIFNRTAPTTGLHPSLLGNQTARNGVLASQARLVSRAAQECTVRTDIETGRKLLQGVSPYFPPSTDSADAAAPKPVCDGMGGPKPPTFNPGNCSSYNLGMCHSGLTGRCQRGETMQTGAVSNMPGAGGFGRRLAFMIAPPPAQPVAPSQSAPAVQCGSQITAARTTRIVPAAIQDHFPTAPYIRVRTGPSGVSPGTCSARNGYQRCPQTSYYEPHTEGAPGHFEPDYPFGWVVPGDVVGSQTTLDASRTLSSRLGPTQLAFVDTPGGDTDEANAGPAGSAAAADPGSPKIEDFCTPVREDLRGECKKELGGFFNTVCEVEGYCFQYLIPMFQKCLPTFPPIFSGDTSTDSFSGGPIRTDPPPATPPSGPDPKPVDPIPVLAPPPPPPGPTPKPPDIIDVRPVPTPVITPEPKPPTPDVTPVPKPDGPPDPPPVVPIPTPPPPSPTPVPPVTIGGTGGTGTSAVPTSPITPPTIGTTDYTGATSSPTPPTTGTIDDTGATSSPTPPTIGTTDEVIPQVPGSSPPGSVSTTGDSPGTSPDISAGSPADSPQPPGAEPVPSFSVETASDGPPQLYGPDLGAELPPATGGGPGNMGGSFCGTIRAPRTAHTVNGSRFTQQPKGIIHVLPDCLYAIRAYHRCGTKGPACALPATGKNNSCYPTQLPGGCCQPGFECRQEGAEDMLCLPLNPLTYASSPSGCNQVPINGSCGNPGDCCADGWSCAHTDVGSKCLPAQTSIIPPSIDSLILDYQSPNAPAGYYPNEQSLNGISGGIGALNLSQYTGIWGGKWCNSSFNPPAPANAPAKPACPVLPGYPVPSFTPINIPPISSLDNGTINVSDGNSTIPLELKAFNWAGWEDGTTFQGGLYPYRSTLYGDFATAVYRAQLLGFNAVRLPFRFSSLNYFPKNWTFACQVNTYASIKAHTLSRYGPYNQSTAASFRMPGPLTSPFSNAAQSGQCNSYIPNGSTLSRFLWTVQYLVGAGFYVIPAYQPSDCSVDNTVCSVPGLFLRNWANLYAAITDLPTYQTMLKGRIMLDLFSEPDIFGILWDAESRHNGMTYPPLPDIYAPAMNALVTLDSGVLFVLEGTGQADKFPGMSWGNGFIVDPSQVARYNLSSAQYFFENLVAVPDLASRTILSGHVYGPETTEWSSGYNYSDFVGMLQTSLGWIPSAGYQPANTSIPGRKFPLLIGELGAFVSSPNELNYLHNFVMYANNAESEEPRVPHRNITSWAWYDGYGSPMSASIPHLTDGATVDWAVISLLTQVPNPFVRPGANMSVWGLGLEPWYIHPNNIVDNQSLPPPPPPGPLGRATRVQGRRLQQSAGESPRNGSLSAVQLSLGSAFQAAVNKANNTALASLSDAAIQAAAQAVGGQLDYFITGKALDSSRCNGFQCFPYTGDPGNLTCADISIQEILQMCNEASNATGGGACSLIRGHTFSYVPHMSMPGGVLYNGVVEAAAQGISQDIKTLTGAAADTSVLSRGLERVVNSMGQTVALPVLRGKNTSDPACNLLVAVQANMVMSAGKPCNSCLCGPLSRAFTPYIVWRWPTPPTQGCVYGNGRRLLQVPDFIAKPVKKVTGGILGGLNQPLTQPGDLLGRLGKGVDIGGYAGGYAAAFKELFSPTGCLAQILNFFGVGPAQVEAAIKDCEDKFKKSFTAKSLGKALEKGLLEASPSPQGGDPDNSGESEDGSKDNGGGGAGAGGGGEDDGGDISCDVGTTLINKALSVIGLKGVVGGTLKQVVSQLKELSPDITKRIESLQSEIGDARAKAQSIRDAASSYVSPIVNGIGSGAQTLVTGTKNLVSSGSTTITNAIPGPIKENPVLKSIGL